MSFARPLAALLLVAAAPAFGKGHKKHDEAPAASESGQPTLSVNCSPPGAEVQVDGEKVATAPMDKPLAVPPGDHTIKVVKLGFAPFLDTFSTKKKKDVKLEVELVPVSGVLHVKSNISGARVLVDGKFVGEAPVDVEMDVGARAVQVEKGGYKDFFKNVLAVAGKDENLDVQLQELPPELNPYYVKPLPPARWYQKKWVWGALVGGFVAVAAAVVIPVVVVSTQGSILDGADVVYTIKGLTFR